MRPSAHGFWVPLVHSQPSLVQREPGQAAIVWQVPGAPGSPWTQQISPSSQAPWVPPMQSQPWPVQLAGPHWEASTQMKPLCTAQQTSP